MNTWSQKLLGRKSGETHITRVTTLTGRAVGINVRRYFDGFKTIVDDNGKLIKKPHYRIGSIMKRLLNYADQGTGADMIKESLIEFQKRVDEQGIDAHIVNVVHDEILVETTPEFAEEVKELLRDCMQSVAEKILQLPVPVDASSGDTWADCH